MSLPHPLRAALSTLLALVVFSAASGLAAAEANRRFNLASGDAAQTLPRFAEQADREIVFSPAAVRGVNTNSVRGDYAPREALTLLVAGTRLAAKQDAGSGAFAVRVETAPPKTEVARASLPPAARAKADGDDAGERIVLDPFVVSETDSVGYSANSTLAGTRLNTALRDVGASISIITSEFLVDTASTNLGELLTLTTGTEVGGALGNFAGGAEAFGRPDQSEARENPEANQRVRGIGPASTTRDF
ncbi:MAG: TonB-dependent receptor, partial [Opitutaceae bacterium]